MYKNFLVDCRRVVFVAAVAAAAFSVCKSLKGDTSNFAFLRKKWSKKKMFDDGGAKPQKTGSLKNNIFFWPFVPFFVLHIIFAIEIHIQKKKIGWDLSSSPAPPLTMPHISTSRYEGCWKGREGGKKAAGLRFLHVNLAFFWCFMNSWIVAHSTPVLYYPKR